MRQFYTITELTQEFDISTRTLRYYEGKGLLSPLRKGRHRLYSVSDRTRLKLILRGKRLGFSLAEISDIVAMYDDSPGEAGQLRLLIAKIAERRTDLLQKRRDIEQTLSELEAVETGCHERLSALDERT
ncbi:MAG: MerR family DNA-binding transcriptional regulator [Fimbriimonadaceae bacterium]|nr:MerR family DNA-binding transcriptional regulator [Alphaproteobacteria bacterium]